LTNGEVPHDDHKNGVVKKEDNLTKLTNTAQCRDLKATTLLFSVPSFFPIFGRTHNFFSTAILVKHRNFVQRSSFGQKSKFFPFIEILSPGGTYKSSTQEFWANFAVKILKYMAKNC